MSKGRTQSLNYSAHAIEALRKDAALLRFSAPNSARAYSRIADLLTESVKFILRNCASYFDPEDLRQVHLDLTHLDLTHLPYPCIALEAPWELETDLKEMGGHPLEPATRRIALCWEARPEYELMPGLNQILTRFEEGGTFVVPIYWSPAHSKWNVCIGGTFIPYQNIVGPIDTHEITPASAMASKAALEAGIAKPRAAHFRAEPFVLLPELFEQSVRHLGGREQAFAHIIQNSLDEAMMLIQACSVLNCANVGTADLTASAALNKKRIAKNLQPFFDYKILEVTNERSPRSNAGNGMDHASPKMHLRRGHLRRLDGKAIWVRPAVVNPNSGRGAVHKDYAVAP